MHNSLDFSKLERIKPREDSWAKVCARLDIEAKKGISTKILPFKLLSAIPIAASIALVSASVLLTAFSSTNEDISVKSILPNETMSWFNSLGSGDDDFETLDNSSALSYLLKEK